MSKKILLVEDDRGIASVYCEYLTSAQYEVTHVVQGAEAIEELSSGRADLMLLDLRLPDMDGLDILRHVIDQDVSVSIIVITGDGSMKNAVDAMKLGASDFLVKPFNKERLLTTVDNTLKRQTLDKVVKTYQEEIDRHEYHGFVGSSLVMQGIYRMIDSAAQSKASVFITGESGTGKEVCAEAIHKASDRKNRPFVAINCSAIPKDLIESELFGHVKGAFTGAIADRKGATLEANGGTVFLDEICEMDISLQPKLLRFLQTRQIQPVGSNKTIDVDVRIICATNRDPWEEVASGRFREDLYYRIHVLPVQLPPLRGREDDALEIAKHFLSLYSKEEGKSFEGFSPEVERALQAFSWPGNVRQLQNVIRNIVVLHDGKNVEQLMLPAPLDGEPAERAPTVSSPPTAHLTMPIPSPPPQQSNNDVSSILPLAKMEIEAIQSALNICAGNVPEAAHYLGISAATIYRKKAAWKETVLDAS
ncbi:MAG: sigma-54-dependent Fis family transcriptional regulator [Rhodospirillaceae bacterium]|nr:MAG: sigma-54-dependent Fis family transcriptional regulator [Rhodospirillaceae bacterium]